MCTVPDNKSVESMRQTVILRLGYFFLEMNKTRLGPNLVCGWTNVVNVFVLSVCVI